MTKLAYAGELVLNSYKKIVPLAQWLEHCVMSAEVCGFNSQGTHILIKQKYIP